MGILGSGTFGNRVRAALLASVATSIAVPAFGQADPGAIPPPPVRRSVDANGVDVILGTFNYNQPSVSIGPSYPEGLSFQNEQLGQGWVANVRSAVTVSGSTYTVTIDGVSDSFTKSGTTYTATEGNGATLADSFGDLVYTSRYGVSAAFALNSGGSPYWNVGYARASSITYPSGVKVNFAYKVTTFCPGGEESGTCPAGYRNALRLQSVTNSNGYQLKFTYASDVLDPPDNPQGEWQRITKVTAINNGVEFCAPGADTCTLTGSWPSLAITPTTVTDAMSRTTQYTNVYDTGGLLTSFNARRPGATSDNLIVTYNTTTHRVISVKNNGVTYSYGYVDSGATRTTTVTDPNGKKIVYVGDTTTSLLASVKDEANRTTGYTYDSKGRVTFVTFPEGNQTKYTYDARGNVTEQRAIAKSSSTLADIVATAAFDATCVNTKKCNKPNSTTDARGKITNYVYDAMHGGVTSVTAPAPTNGAVRPKIAYDYDTYQAYFKNSTGSIVASGQDTYRVASLAACTTSATCVGAAEEVKRTIAYGPQAAGTMNNLLPVSQSSGSGDGLLTVTSKSTWDQFGNRTYVDGPLSGTADTTRTLYDADREVVGVIGPDPDGASTLRNRAVRLTYNADGQVTNAEQGTTTGQTDTNWTAFVSLQQAITNYDANARVANQQAKANAVTYGITQYHYDALGRQDCAAVRMNSALWSSLPASACTGQTPGSYGSDRITKTDYTDASEVLRTTSGVGTSAAGIDAELSYTSNRRVQTAADGNGNLTTYEYDGFDRLSKTRYPSPTTAGTSSTTDFELLTYDSGSRVTDRQLRDATHITYGYDNLDRLTARNRPLPTTNRNLTYTYDNLGRPLTATGSLPTSSTFVWDALGRLVSETDPVSGSISWLYDAAGRRTRQTWNADAIWAGYSYLVTGEMTVVTRNGGSSVATYDYDDMGRRSSLARANGVTTTSNYNTGSQLTSMAHVFPSSSDNLTTTFTYNPAGQIATRKITRDSYAATPPPNGITPYTVNGLNQATKAGTGSGATTIGYDDRGNVTSIGTDTYTYGSDNAMQTAPGGTFVTDALDRLAQISAEGTSLRYAGTEITSEHDTTTGAVKMRYILGAGADEPLAAYTGAGVSNRAFPISDERGSIIALTDNAGAVTQINSYDEYGVPDAGNVGRFQYTGQAWIPSMGAYYYKARIYNPALGRFMQTDPIGYGAGMNLYGYVGADPINFTDQLGLQGEDEDIVVTANIPKPQNGAPPPPPHPQPRPDGTTPSYNDEATVQDAKNRDNEGKDIVVVCDLACQLRSATQYVNRTARQFSFAVTKFSLDVFGALNEGFGIPEACCFTRGTLINTPTGLRPIETLKVGDVVISRDGRTGRTASKAITSITPAHHRVIWTVTLSYRLGSGTKRVEKYETTADHPWRTLSGDWKKTSSLTSGVILARRNGSGVIISVKDTGLSKLTYNLEVADFHTYFVGKGETWVHNACKKERIPGKSGKDAAKNVPSWVRGQRPDVGQTGAQFATQLLNDKYGIGNWGTGPGSEYSQIQKYADRGFR